MTNPTETIKQRLAHLRQQLKAECISFGELAELATYKQYLWDDPDLAEAAGIPEEEFQHHHAKGGQP